MVAKKTKEDPGARQLPVRFAGDDSRQLQEMQDNLEEDAATIIRWAVKQYYKIVSDADWKITNRGEPILASPEQAHAPPSSRAKAIP